MEQEEWDDDENDCSGNMVKLLEVTEALLETAFSFHMTS